MEYEERIQEALEATEILKSPRQLLSNEEDTELKYYVLTEPAYLDIYPDEGPETRIREGWINWNKPKLITPGYLLKADGFSEEAKKAIKMMAGQDPDMASIAYQMHYTQKIDNVRTISADIDETARRLEEEIDEASEFLTAIIVGLDDLWDVSLMKFAQEYMTRSAQESQVPEMESKGYLTRGRDGRARVTRNLDGLPIAAKDEIENLFQKVESGDKDPSVLKQELDRWGVYHLYEDRFLNLFR
ncbi:hypothetical protein I0Q91_08345 [Halanaerobiaceae bacterium Z-7014]|uniref:Uncharacterized protein n=1 Tax=Halonatronomonas betaini TaxID=2778430 RepID=A0A931FA06_9FIRM|nr:hypothetical protein [Halonatronomonas betaini]MBF8437084.1 hypothetical protein [Halonatronomonas betaini]